ncbi:MAG TPA: hypothetical protein VJT10_22805 [Steroidobacteraceae bacterium]|jgi:hypothetical protein|nr:hypothetical protein [Steroidobacteraceae bacterium]
MKVDQGPADPNRQDELERLVTRALRNQPLRHAPATLERRVLAQIASGAAIAPWRRGFAHWPMAARLAFLAASVGVVKLALSIALWLSAPLASPGLSFDLPSQMAWLQTLLVAMASIARTVPSVWVHAGIAFFILMYVALFGIGATAYRTVRAAH